MFLKKLFVLPQQVTRCSRIWSIITCGTSMLFSPRRKSMAVKKKTGCFCLRRGDVHGGSWLSQERDRYSISQSSRSKVDCAMVKANTDRLVLKWSIGRVVQCTAPPTSMSWHSLLCRVNYCLPYQTILARPLSILQIRSLSCENMYPPFSHT